MAIPPLFKLLNGRNLPRHVTLGAVAFIVVVVFLTLTVQLSHIDTWPTSKSQTEPLNSVQYSSGSLEVPLNQDNSGDEGLSPPANTERLINETLGFSKVLVVGLPERSDKRDAMVLTSSLTGFHVEWVDGVRGEAVVDKALPFGVDRKKLWENNLGSWRGHMNAVRRIVDEGLESALIMEDDMDWDVGLKAQLGQVAQGVQQLLGTSTSPLHSTSPYGDEWDVLWLGHCGEVFPEMLDENQRKPADDASLVYMQRKFVIENDTTVPPRDHLTGLVDFEHYPEHTRWVHITGAPICTFAYALSRRGAKKVLFDLSVDHLMGPFDNSLAGLCRRAVSVAGVSKDALTAGDSGLNAKCISVTPPLFFHHKAKGNLASDSDIQTIADGAIRQKGSTENIVWSARDNIKNMIMGIPVQSQFIKNSGERVLANL